MSEEFNIQETTEDIVTNYLRLQEERISGLEKQVLQLTKALIDLEGVLITMQQNSLKKQQRSENE